MRTDVQHGSVAILDTALARDIGCDELAAANQFGVLCRGFLQPAHVLLRNHEYMGWSLRIDVVERVGIFVFVDFLGRYFPANDAAEQAVVHKTVHSSELETRRAGHEYRRDGEGARILYLIVESFCSAVLGAGHDEPIRRWSFEFRFACALRNRSVEPHKKDRALRSLGVVHDFFGKFTIVILYANAHPPVADGAAETLHLSGLITVGQMIG